jgi:hypothetical protein
MPSQQPKPQAIEVKANRLGRMIRPKKERLQSLSADEQRVIASAVIHLFDMRMSLARISERLGISLADANDILHRDTRRKEPQPEKYTGAKILEMKARTA